jgi:predicted SAM-dependent methyltransferase
MKQLEIGPSAEWGRLGDDWETMDNEKFEYVDIVHDIHDIPFPIKDETYDLVYMAHVLEHVHWMKTVDVLKEIRRIVKFGGKLEMWAPDLNKIISAVINYDAVPEMERKVVVNGQYTSTEIPHFEWVNQKIFTYRHDPGKGGQLHEAIFNPEFLKDCLTRSGFVDIQPLKNPKGPYPSYHGWCQFGLEGTKSA